MAQQFKNVLSLPGIVTGAVGTERGDTEFFPSRAQGQDGEAEKFKYILTLE